MVKVDEGFSLPTKEAKEEFVLREVTELMKIMEVDEFQVSNLDQLNLQMRLAYDLKSLDYLEARGYEKVDSSLATLYHKFDDETAVASNVTLDKGRNTVIISMNF